MIALLALLAVGSSPLLAIQDGEILLTVVNDDGKPLRDVKVVITSDEIPDFREELTTNKKGRCSLRVFYAEHLYKARFTKDGFEPTESLLQPKVGGKVRFTVPLSAAGQGSAAHAEAPPAGLGEEVAKTFNEGLEAGRKGDIATAEARFETVLEIQPDLVQAHSALAILYFENDRAKEADEHVEAWLAADPKNATALRIHYEVMKALGDAEGIAAARAALGKGDPKGLAASLTEEGRRLFNDGQRQAALGPLEEAIALDPEAPLAHYLLGLCHLAGEHPEEAREYLERFLELAPDSQEAATARELLQHLES